MRKKQFVCVGKIVDDAGSFYVYRELEDASTTPTPINNIPITKDMLEIGTLKTNAKMYHFFKERKQ
jgi:hypothetical protein